MNLDLNPMTESSVKNLLVNMADEIYRCQLRWAAAAEKIGNLTTQDLIDMGFTDETTRNYIGTMKGAMEDMVRAFNNETVSGADPSYIVGLLRNSQVF